MSGFTLSVHSNIKDVKKQLSRIQKKQIPAATQWALNGTARKVKLAEEREIKNVFNMPTSRTKKSLWIKWAKKNKLEAIVKIKDESFKGTPASKYLSAQVEGGARKHKGFEKLLIAKGQMPGSMYAIPSRTIKKNQYGNVSSGLIQKILSGLGSQRDRYQNASAKSKTHGKYFSGVIGNVHGIWDVTKLHKGGLALLFIFVSGAPKYKKKFNFNRIADKTSKTVFKREFDKALRKALDTAR